MDSIYALDDNLMKNYISEALQNCDYSNEELYDQYTKGDKSAREKLIFKNYGMVRKLAYKYNLDNKPSISTDDLIQEGYIGLMEAIENYKPDLEGSASFIGYAIFWIKQKIVRFMKDKGRPIRIPENKYNTYKEILKAGELMEAEMMRKPTLKDLSKATGRSYDEIMDLRNIFSMVDSLDRPIGEEGESFFLRDTIQDFGEPYEDVEQKGYVDWLREQLEDGFTRHLSIKQAEILKAKYGLDGFQDMTYAEVGELFGIDQQQAKSEAGRAFRKLTGTAWYVRLKRDLVRDEVIRIYSRNSYEAAEARVDKQKADERRSLHGEGLTIENAVGENIEERTSTGAYIRTGLITYVDHEQVSIFWGMEGYTTHNAEILVSMVKNGRNTSILIRKP